MLIHPGACIGFHLPSARRVGKPLERDNLVDAVDAEAAAIGVQLAARACLKGNVNVVHDERADAREVVAFASGDVFVDMLGESDARRRLRVVRRRRRVAAVEGRAPLNVRP